MTRLAASGMHTYTDWRRLLGTWHFPDKVTGISGQINQLDLTAPMQTEGSSAKYKPLCSRSLYVHCLQSEAQTLACTACSQMLRALAWLITEHLSQ